MKKILYVISILALMLVGITGCGSNTNSAASTGSQTSAESGQTAASPAAQSPDQAMKDGITKLLRTAKQLNTAIAAGDGNKIKATGPQLEENWKTFEDTVKAKQPDLYEKVEQYLDPEVAGSQASVLDKQAMGKLNDQLIETLNELLQRLH